MFNLIKGLLFGSSNIDYLESDSVPNEASSFSQAEQRAKSDTALGGSAEHSDTAKIVSLNGQELPQNWPTIISPDEESKRYEALYDLGDDKSQPPSNAHIERLSYELQNGDKKLRYFAVNHQRDMQGQDDPNMVQYDLLEKKFNESPPELVLYEGYIDDVNHPLTRDQAISLGEPAFMAYLVQQHNAGLREGDRPVVIESADQHVNTLPNDQRDRAIVINLAEKFRRFNHVDIIMGSGHAIREEDTLRQFFGTNEKEITESKMQEIRQELSGV